MQKNPSIRQTHFIGVLLPDERAARAQRREIHDGCVDAFDVADPDRAELRSRVDDARGRAMCSWIAMVVDRIARAIAFVIRFKRGKWAKRTVL